MPRFVAFLLFGSGLTALIYQTAWQRLLRLVFGASTAASAAVLAIFLGGLGLGGALLGKRAERSPRPLMLYGNLEIGVGLAAAITPLLLMGAEWVYIALGGSVGLGTLGATALRLLLGVLVMGPAAVLMGGTLPAAARAVEVEGDNARGRLALLYATNTLGAVVGALLATFFLFELFGTRLSLWVAVLVNLLVGVLARARARSAEPIPITTQTASSDTQPVSPLPDLSPAWLIYGSAGVLGVAFIALELVWYRMLGPVLGGSNYMFGLILAVALAGIGTGGAIYARRDHQRPATLSLLAATVALEAACVGLPLALGDRVALFAAYTRPMAAMGFPWLVMSWTLTSLLVVFPAALVAGYQFPVLFALLGRGRQGVARQVGLAYAFNTLGSITGAILTGFWLLPSVGALGVWRGITATLAALALLALVVSWRTERRRSASGAVAGLAASLGLLCLFAQGPTAAWRHTPIGAGRADISGLNANQLKYWTRVHSNRLLAEYDGVESMIGIFDADGYSFLVNGKSDGSVILDRGTQTMLALLPALVHGAPKRIFVLGLGTGMSAGYASAIPGVEHVDVAELEPAVLEVARLAAPVNLDVLARNNVSLFIGDGREFMLSSKSNYDLVVSEPSNPYRAGIASLFTQDFYQLVRERLNEGGIFAQWVQAYELDIHTLRIVLKTLRSVFPRVEAWQTEAGDLLLLASAHELSIDVGRLRQQLTEEPFKHALPRTWLTQDAEGVLGHFVATSELLEDISEAVPAPVNSDDSTVLEYAFARQVGSKYDNAADDLLELAIMTRSARPRVKGAVDWERMEELRGRAYLFGLDKLPDFLGQSPTRRRRMDAVDAGCRGRVDLVMRLWESQPDREPHDVIERYVVGAGYAQYGRDEALPQAAALERAGYLTEAALIHARYLAARQGRKPAMAATLGAIKGLRQVPLPLCNAATEALFLLGVLAGGHDELRKQAVGALLPGPFLVHVREEQRRRLLQRLALGSAPELCLKALGRELSRPWWERDFLAARAGCLERAGHPLANSAQQDFVEYMTATAGSIEIGIPGAPSLSKHEGSMEEPISVSPPSFDAGAAPLPSSRDSGPALDAAPGDAAQNAKDGPN